MRRALAAAGFLGSLALCTATLLLRSTGNSESGDPVRSSPSGRPTPRAASLSGRESATDASVAAGSTGSHGHDLVVYVSGYPVADATTEPDETEADGFDEIPAGSMLEQDGEPIGGARVEIDDESGSAQSALTGFDGRATFVSAGDSVRVRVGASGSADVETTVRWPWDAPVQVTLGRAGFVHGRVLTSSGHPLEGARVTAVGVQLESCVLVSGRRRPPPARLGRTVSVAISDSEGRFTLPGVPYAGPTVLRIEAPERRTLWKVLPEDWEKKELAYRLAPGGVIAGAVLGPTGAPVSGARVCACLADADRPHPVSATDAVDLPACVVMRPEAETAEDAWAGLTATTDARGRFALPGAGLGETYGVAATARGFAASEVVSAVVTGDVTVDLRLHPACSVLVRCRDESGRPCPGIAVAIDADGHPVAAKDTDAEGWARFVELAPADVSVRVWDSSRWRSVASQRLGEPPLHVDVTLAVPVSEPERAPSEPRVPPPPRPSRARLLPSAGTAPPTRVEVRHYAAEGCVAGSTHPCVEDADGATSFEWVARERDGCVAFEMEGFLPVLRMVSAIDPRPVDLGTLRLDRGHTLEGVVVDPQGRPLPDVDVDVAWSEPCTRPGMAEVLVTFHRRGTTDRAGIFRVAALPQRVSISMEDLRFLDLRADVALPSAPRRFVVDPGAVLRVRVVDADGHPRPRSRVVATARPSGDPVAWGITDVEGVARCRLGPGDHDVLASTDHGRLEASRVVRVTEREDREVVLALPPRK